MYCRVIMDDMRSPRRKIYLGVSIASHVRSSVIDIHEDIKIICTRKATSIQKLLLKKQCLDALPSVPSMQ